MRYVLAALTTLVGIEAASAAMKTEAIDYKHGDVQLSGYLAYDDSVKDKRPGVLIVHDWLGHSDFARKRAEAIAELGYVGFALDMYGKGVLAKDPQEASGKASVFKKDRALMRSRAAAGLEVLAKHAAVDPKRLACMGYCFGGTTTLELARSGADLDGVVIFHGNLETPDPADAKKIKGKVLVLHGADDPIVPDKEVAAFEKEMRDAGVDWELVKFGGAVHSFTNKAAGNDPKRGVAYNKTADERSWEAMRAFFKEIFATK